MYCEMRAPLEMNTLKMRGLPPPRSSTSCLPLPSCSVTGVTPCGSPSTSSGTPAGLDSTTSVPVREKRNAGAGTYCAAVNAPAIDAPKTPIVTINLNRLLKRLDITPSDADDPGTYMVCCTVSCARQTSCFGCGCGTGGGATSLGAAATGGAGLAGVRTDAAIVR